MTFPPLAQARTRRRYVAARILAIAQMRTLYLKLKVPSAGQLTQLSFTMKEYAEPCHSNIDTIIIQVLVLTADISHIIFSH